MLSAVAGQVYIDAQCFTSPKFFLNTIQYSGFKIMILEYSRNSKCSIMHIPTCCLGSQMATRHSTY